ncbi:hypothetical protein [Actinokineospora diospyrosa]|uniref:Uncharacterized protein n=1 Tax=Actinokineospora diospyrosa TaxID=103728 RepID=A0ABT1IH09_9PSEU|nr:hypothetical protein [Actinokineospora diospyrosa]MCP2271928.1 hypothetical protein [Actinokineospora diospyrosa]
MPACTRQHPRSSVDVTAAVLYLLPYTRAQWRRLEPAGLAPIVAGVVADPLFRVPEVTALVLAAEHNGTLAHPHRLAAARRMARRVLAA